MKGRTFLCFLVLHHSVSALELTGPSVLAARLGSDVLVPCTFIVDKPPVDPKHLTIFWHVQDFQDKEILSYDKTVVTTSSRYSLSTEALAAGIANLTISSIVIPDGGMYKCSVIYGAERKETEVWLDIGAPPQVTITGKTVIMNAESVLRCSVTGFYPVHIDIKWFKDGEKLEDNIFGNNRWRNPDGTYSVNSTVTITPTEEDRERNFSCRVRHKYLQEPLQEDFHLEYEERSLVRIIVVCSAIVSILVLLTAAAPLFFRILKRESDGMRLRSPSVLTDTEPFIIRDIEGPRKIIDGEEATLYCTVDTCPEDLCVAWLTERDGQVQEILTSQMRGHTEEEEESLLDTSYVIRSQREGRQYSTSLSFKPHMDRHKDVTFICRAFSRQHNAEKTFHCKTVYGKPKMSQLAMSSVSGDIKYVLNFERFYPKSIKIVWTCGVGRAEEVVSSTESISDNPDRSYNVSSEVRIPEDRHKDPGFRVRVTWNHESMDHPESRELSIRDPDVKKENMEAESIYENSDIANHWITEKFIYDTEEAEDVSEDLKVEEINENTGAEV